MIDIKYFHPFRLIGIRKPKIDSDLYLSDDIYEYGISLDLTTECFFYTYDWGYGFNFRLFGFGFEINKCGF